MNVKPLAEESLGVRSMCTFVETGDVNILIDPGISLSPRRFGLPPHPREYKALIEGRGRILKYASRADVLTVSHYHLDHYTPSFEEWHYHWSSPEIARHIYEGKILLVKDYRSRLSFNQRRRGWLFLKTCGRYAKSVENADGKSFRFGGTEISFSEPVYHGSEGTELGSVLMTLIEDGGERLVFTSDVQGPIEDKTLESILRWRPDLLIVGGPPLYLSGLRVSRLSVERGIRNLAKLASEVPIVVLGHHLLRSVDWREASKPVFDAALEKGNRVLTFAEYLGLEEELLEARRKILYEEDPPSREFLRWSKLRRPERGDLKPPGLSSLLR